MSDSNTPIKINAPRVDNTYSTSKIEKTRPDQAPKSKKDFARMLQSATEKDNGDIDDPIAESEEDIRQASTDGTIAERSATSLFDLSGKKDYTSKRPIGRKPSESGSNDAEVAEGGRAKAAPNVRAPTVSSGSHESGDLEGSLEVAKGLDSGKEGTLVDTSDRAEVAARNAAASKMTERRDELARDNFSGDTGSSFGGAGKEKFTTRFVTEQPDIAAVNPLANQAQSINAAPVEAGQKMIPASNIQDIINQLVEKANQIKLDGQTDTTITLKHPPLLAGANLIVTSFDSARGQFNISFENLSQAAKNLLDMRVNQESLLSALQQKGYAVHILTTTTLSERLVIETPNPSGQREDQREQERQAFEDGRGNRRPYQDDDEFVT